MDYSKEFISENKSVRITRGDYECMPCSMRTDKISDNEMQLIANKIEDILHYNYRIEYKDINNEENGDILFEFTEKVWLDFGITYYEDEVEVEDFTNNGYGDFIKCVDCGIISLIHCGDTLCPHCKSTNIMWVNDELKETTFEKANEYLNNKNN